MPKGYCGDSGHSQGHTGLSSPISPLFPPLWRCLIHVNTKKRSFLNSVLINYLTLGKIDTGSQCPLLQNEDGSYELLCQSNESHPASAKNNWLVCHGYCSCLHSSQDILILMPVSHTGVSNTTCSPLYSFVDTTPNPSLKSMCWINKEPLTGGGAVNYLHSYASSHSVRHRSLMVEIEALGEHIWPPSFWRFLLIVYK